MVSFLVANTMCKGPVLDKSKINWQLEMPGMFEPIYSASITRSQVHPEARQSRVCVAMDSKWVMASCAREIVSSSFGPSSSFGSRPRASVCWNHCFPAYFPTASVSWPRVSVCWNHCVPSYFPTASVSCTEHANGAAFSFRCCLDGPSLTCKNQQ